MIKTGIICHQYEVRGLEHGYITCLRRPLIPQPTFHLREGKKRYGYWQLRFPDGSYTVWEEDTYTLAGFEGEKCPYGEKGDIVRIKETWWHYKASEIEMASFEGGTIVRKGRDAGYKYHKNKEFHPPAYPHLWKKKSASKMPKWATRRCFKIIDMWVAQVQRATIDQAEAEGMDGRYGILENGKVIHCSEQGGIPVLEQHQMRWDERWKKKGFSYDSNPWTYVLKLEKIK